MNKYTPFRCVHFFLDQQQHWTEPVLPDEGYYVVIWWRSFPLGEVYLTAGETAPGEIEQKIIYAIVPALKHYGGNGAHDYQTIEEARQVCDSILTEPVTVPLTAEVTLVICTKDRAENLRVCLESIQHLRCKPAEIIVVDNATRDESTKKIVSAFPDVVYLREDRPGLDIARNTGAKSATKPIVVYTDDDTVIHPLWIYHTWKTFDDSNVSAMTGLVLASELKTEAQWIFEKYWPFNRGYTDKQYDSSFFKGTLPSGPPVWNIGAGANMAFRRKVFLETGYFDERLDVGAAGCNGDSEMWYRILAAGGVIHYNPRAVVSHFHRRSLHDLKSQIFSYMRGFTAAVLIQHQRFGHKGNLKHLFLELPKYYCYLIARGFPRYSGRFTTIFREMKGMYSGLIFYLKNRNTPANIK